MSLRTPQNIGELVSKLITTRIDLKITSRRAYDDWFWKQWWHDQVYKARVRVQTIKVLEHQKYGSDLAVAKFVIGKCRGKVMNHRGIWINKTKNLPPDYDKSFKLYAISAFKTNLLTEGIDNFVGLEHLEFLDLRSNPHLDEFSCDQLARQFRNSTTLNEIDISENPRISIYALEALLRIPSLRRLVAYNTAASEHPEIDLFVLGAEDDRKCDVLVHANGRKFNNQDLEDVRMDAMKRLETKS